MNKKFIVPLFVLFISSFFLFSSNVRASDYSFTPNVDFSYINNDLNSFINILESSSYSSTCPYYIIFYQKDNLYAYCRVQTSGSNLSFNRSSHKLYFGISGSDTIRYLYSNGTLTSVTPDSISSNWYIYISSDGTTLDFSKFIYANYVVPLYDNTITFDYNNSSYTFNSTTSPTLYYLYNQSPPVPSDDTPLLTSFIDISIEKLAVICNFITSSYIYLAPFVIFIFYFVILLFRRFR